MSIVMEQHARWAPARARLWHGGAGQETAKPVVRASIPSPPQPAPVDLLTSPSWLVIAQLVAAKHGLKVRDLTERDGPRVRGSIEARQEAMFLLYKHTDMTLPGIGRRFGGRDHTTVLYSIRRHFANLEGLTGISKNVLGVTVSCSDRMPKRVREPKSKKVSAPA